MRSEGAEAANMYPSTSKRRSTCKFPDCHFELNRIGQRLKYSEGRLHSPLLLRLLLTDGAGMPVIVPWSSLLMR